jgi:hypothetical protein
MSKPDTESSLPLLLPEDVATYVNARIKPFLDRLLDYSASVSSSSVGMALLTEASVRSAYLQGFHDAVALAVLDQEHVQRVLRAVDSPYATSRHH